MKLLVHEQSVAQSRAHSRSHVKACERRAVSVSAATTGRSASFVSCAVARSPGSGTLILDVVSRGKPVTFVVPHFHIVVFVVITFVSLKGAKPRGTMNRWSPVAAKAYPINISAWHHARDA